MNRNLVHLATNRICVSVLLFLSSLSGIARAGIIDSINPNATPLEDTDYGLSEIGWYYTPTTDYTLNGIFSSFQPISFGTGDHTITVQIQSDRPANGGAVLGEADFQANSFLGGRLGADFSSSVSLQAGQTYFVDFLNVDGMGTDIGQFTIAPDGTHLPSAGATTRLGAFYTGLTFATGVAGYSADETLPTGDASGLEPILFFDGSLGGGLPTVTPEPSTGLLMLLGFGAAFFSRYGYRRSGGPN